MPVGNVRSCDLHKSIYVRMENMDMRFLKPARTPSDKRIGGSVSYEEIHRWMVYREGIQDFQIRCLDFRGEPANLPEIDKALFLRSIFGEPIAKTGVLFSPQFEAFKSEKVLPYFDLASHLNINDIVAKFEISGIVQNCGTRGAFQRIFNMSRLTDNAEIVVQNDKENTDLVDVTIKGDLFSTYLFLGLINPERIFHGVDIGQGFSPHNLIIAAANSGPVDLPMGMYIYTINIDEILRLKFFSNNGESLTIKDQSIQVAKKFFNGADKFILSI